MPENQTSPLSPSPSPSPPPSPSSPPPPPPPFPSRPSRPETPSSAAENAGVPPVGDKPKPISFSPPPPKQTPPPPATPSPSPKARSVKVARVPKVVPVRAVKVMGGRPPRAPSPSGRRTFYLHPTGSGNGPWIFAFTLLFVLCTGALCYFNFDKWFGKTSAEELAEDAPPERQELDPNFKLKDIIEQPETDGERPPPNAPVSDEDSAEYEDYGTPSEVEVAPPPVKKAEPKKLPKPIVVKKTISYKPPVNPNLPTPSDNRTVDILIVYTADTKKSLGGHKGVLERATEVVAYTNEKFHERKVRGTLRLVGLVETEYSPPTGAKDVVKEGLGAVSTGYARCNKESVLKIREKVGADLVCMWVAANRRGGGGLAVIHGAFSSMNYPVTSIFRHEMAHNFGWNHDDRQNYSMINRNFPGMVKWMRKKIAKDKLYVQYTTEYSDED